MAIDTEQKRASSFIDDCGIKIPPDGAFSATDRGWLVGQYSGIASGPPVTVIPAPIWVDEVQAALCGAEEAQEAFSGPEELQF